MRICPVFDTIHPMIDPPWTRGYAWPYAGAGDAARAVSLDAHLPGFMPWLYGWMASGLVLTGVVAHYLVALLTSSQTLLTTLRFLPVLFAAVLVVALGLALVLAALLPRLPTVAAIVIFCVYSAITGVWSAGFFLVWASGTLDRGLFVAAAMYAGMSFIGFATGRNLLTGTSVALMAVIGGLLATTANLALRGSLAEALATYGCIVVFVGLTAADISRLKWLAIEVGHGAKHVAILGALLLYTDIFNLPLRWLRGSGRNAR